MKILVSGIQNGFKFIFYCLLQMCADCISYSTKSDIHEIIMNPPDGWGSYSLMKYTKYFCQHLILENSSFSPHVIPKKKRTRGKSKFNTICEWLWEVFQTFNRGLCGVAVRVLTSNL